ncbi:MAG: recombination protein NinB [Pseudomonadota bacterium]
MNFYLRRGMEIDPLIKLVHREVARRWCENNEVEIKVTNAKTKRSVEQNALMWKLLADFSRAKAWEVNGEAAKLSAEDWKHLTTASFETLQRMAPNLERNGFVMLGQSTSRFSQQKMSEYIEFLTATAVDLNVPISAREG